MTKVRGLIVINDCSLDDVALERWFDEGGAALAPPLIPGLPPEAPAYEVDGVT